MNEYKLSALLELKDKFTNVAQKAGSSLGTLKDKVGGIAGKIKKSFSGVQGALATVGVGIGAGAAVSVLKSSVEAYANLEDQIRRNRAIMSATAEQEKQLMQQTRDYLQYTMLLLKQLKFKHRNN